MIRPFTFRFAWRDGRTELRRSRVHLMALALGVAGLVALSSLQQDVEEGISVQGRDLLGADVRISSSAPFTEEALAVVDSLAAEGVRVARSTALGTSVYHSGSDMSRFLQVVAVSPEYPLYGSPRDDPEGSWSRLAGGTALLEPQAAAQMETEVGDTVRVGEAPVRIVGEVEGLPAELGLRGLMGARIFVSEGDLEAMGLLGFGTVAQRRVDLRTPDGEGGTALAHRLRDRLSTEGLSIRSAEERAETLVEGVGFFGDFLALVGLAALLLGGIGVASATHGRVEDKVSRLAVLRCLGARERDVMGAFVLQSLVLAMVGSAAGALLGVGVQHAGAAGLSAILDLTIAPALHVGAVLSGVAVGLAFGLVFSVAPLAQVRGISPLQVFRREVEEGAGGGSWAGVAAVFVGAVFAGAIAKAPDLSTGLWYGFGFLVLCALLLAMARALSMTARATLGEDASFPRRHGLSSLFRPGNQTGVVVLALGCGISLLAAAAVVERSFLERLLMEETGGDANLFIFDVQSDQRERVGEILEGGTGAAPSFTPIVSARIARFRGREVSDLLDDPSVGIPGWTLRRTYRNTYRLELAPGEEVVRGEWWEEGGGDGTTRISVEQGLAMDLGIRMGDSIVWDVQGVPVVTEVANIRSVDWARFEPNFFVVFEPGALEGAPATYATAVHVPDSGERGRLQGRLVSEVPGVAVLDFAQLREELTLWSSRIGLAVLGLSLFTALIGTVVLMAVVLSRRRRKAREIALLRTLGAGRAQLRTFLAWEYGALGATAGVAGVVLGTCGAVLLLVLQFQVPVAFPGFRLALLTGACVALVMVSGWLATLSFLRHPPSVIVRGENDG